MAKPKATHSSVWSSISSIFKRVSNSNSQSVTTSTPMSTTLAIDDRGTELSYIDSGVPNGTQNYITIFAIHGTVFTGPIWERVIAIAPKSSVRFVAVNRRDYPGSTPLSPDDLNALNSGTDEQKADYLKARGLEFATFIELFSEKNNLPAASADGTVGGFGVVGWSLGCAFALATIAAVDALPAPAQARWKASLRALVLQEPPTVSLGKGIPPDGWTPLVDQSMPAEARTAFFSHWITSYFKHGDLLSRDPKAISYVIPATFRPPTIYSMTEEEIKRTVYEPTAFGSDMSLMIFLGPQIDAVYKKAVYNKELRALVPHLKVTVFSGDSTASFSIPSQWEIEDDDKAAGGGFITVKWIPGFNHLSHVDEPAATLKVYTDGF